MYNPVVLLSPMLGQSKDELWVAFEPERRPELLEHHCNLFVATIVRCIVDSIGNIGRDEHLVHRLRRKLRHLSAYISLIYLSGPNRQSDLIDLLPSFA